MTLRKLMQAPRTSQSSSLGSCLCGTHFNIGNLIDVFQPIAWNTCSRVLIWGRKQTQIISFKVVSPKQSEIFEGPIVKGGPHAKGGAALG